MAENEGGFLEAGTIGDNEPRGGDPTVLVDELDAARGYIADTTATSINRLFRVFSFFIARTAMLFAYLASAAEARVQHPVRHPVRQLVRHGVIL